MFYLNFGRCLSMLFLFIASFNVLLPSSPDASDSSYAVSGVAPWLRKIADLTISAVIGKRWRPIRIQSSDIKVFDLDSMRVRLKRKYVERVLNHCIDFETMRIDVAKVRRHLQTAIQYDTLISARHFEMSIQCRGKIFENIDDIEDRVTTFQEFFWHETGSRTQTIVRLSLLACAVYGFGTAICQISNKVAAKVRHKREKPQ